MNDYRIGRYSYCGLCTHSATKHGRGTHRGKLCAGIDHEPECDCTRTREEVLAGAKGPHARTVGAQTARRRFGS